MAEQTRDKGNKYPLQIINAGMFRGGTSSLSLALQDLGFGPTWHPITNSEELTAKGLQWLVENNIVQKVANNEHVDFDEWLRHIDCRSVMDAPIVWIWKELFAQYPDARVIISARPYDEWSKSYVNLLQYVASPITHAMTKTDKGTKFLLDFWEHSHCDEHNGYQGLTELLALQQSQRDEILKRDYYEKHLETAKRIVPEDQLLIFDPKEGWEPLCNFLKVPVPNKPYPNTNTTKELHQFMQEWRKDVLRSFVGHTLKQPCVLCAIAVLFALLTAVLFG